MDTNSLILLGVALLPAIVLSIYIFKKDSAEKEPIGLLAKLAIGGVIICFPAGEIESVVIDAVNQVFGSFAVVENGQAYLPEGMYNLYVLTENTIGVALIEEGLKFLVMWLLTRNNKNFNYLFDGIVYAVFVSLGFAGFENVLYAFNHGMSTALLRMITAVPAHTFFAILMGYYYSQWHVYEVAKQKEIRLIAQHVLSSRNERLSGKKYLVLALTVPTLIHGFYDYCCSISEVWATLVFIGLMIFLYIYCFMKVRKMSQYDIQDVTAADAILIRKYPSLVQYYEELRIRKMNEEYNHETSFY